MKRVRKRLLLTVCAMVLPLAVTLIIYNVYSMIALNRQPVPAIFTNSFMRKVLKRSSLI